MYWRTCFAAPAQPSSCTQTTKKIGSDILNFTKVRVGGLQSTVNVSTEFSHVNLGRRFRADSGALTFSQ